MNGKQKNIEQVVMLQQSKFDMDWKHIYHLIVYQKREYRNKED
jgi:hypothetical protein